MTKPKNEQPELFVKEMRRAMESMEAIAGTTDIPMSDRLKAMRRVTKFWQDTINGIDPPKPDDDLL